MKTLDQHDCEWKQRFAELCDAIAPSDGPEGASLEYRVQQAGWMKVERPGLTYVWCPLDGVPVDSG